MKIGAANEELESWLTPVHCFTRLPCFDTVRLYSFVHWCSNGRVLVETSSHDRSYHSPPPHSKTFKDLLTLTHT